MKLRGETIFHMLKSKFVGSNGEVCQSPVVVGETLSYTNSKTARVQEKVKKICNEAAVGR